MPTQGCLEKGAYLRSRVAHENVELLELRLDLAEHLLDLVWTRNIGLDDETVRTAFADFSERVVGSTLVLVVVDGDPDAMLGELQRDSSANATGASSDQGMFAIERHINLLLRARPNGVRLSCGAERECSQTEDYLKE